MKATVETVKRMVEVSEDVLVVRISTAEKAALMRALGRARDTARDCGNTLDAERFEAIFRALTEIGTDVQVPT